MQTTLRIDDAIYREAKSAAARRGITLTRYIEEALKAFRQAGRQHQSVVESEAEERNRLMEALLQQTAHFRIGKRPTREEMNER
jgi:antitoxin component of RelBE/YafQ-DinJ toxin-antitoxin module